MIQLEATAGVTVEAKVHRFIGSAARRLGENGDGSIGLMRADRSPIRRLPV